MFTYTRNFCRQGNLFHNIQDLVLEEDVIPKKQKTVCATSYKTRGQSSVLRHCGQALVRL